MKYIDAEKLKAEIEKRQEARQDTRDSASWENEYWPEGEFCTRDDEDDAILSIITSLQQDETQVDRMLCSQVWWEEQGWIMIPPDATIEGIDSLLRQVKKKLQQEQSKVDLENEIITQWSKCNPTDEGMGSEYAIIAVEQFDAIARYFCELGRKQVLQEIYDGKTKPVDKITAAWLDDK